MKKNIIIIFLFGLFYTGIVYSQQSGEDGTITWELVDGMLTISGDGPMPDYYGKLTPWNAHKEMITSIVIGEGVTSIGSSAFHTCYNITSVILCSTLTAIGINAFALCENLLSITIPASVTSIGEGVFSGCYALTSITVEASNPNYISEDGVLFNNTKTTLLVFPCGIKGSYVIPETVNTIGNGAFEMSSRLTSVIIPQSVLSIGNYAFYRSGITSLSIPSSVTSIGDNALAGCSNMTSISVDTANPEYVSEDGILFNKDTTTLVAFPSGRWGDYTIPESVDTIGTAAFWECKLSSVTIPNSVLSIGIMAFRLSGNLKSITIPSSVKSIGYFAFLDCGLTSVIIFSPETEIGGGAFDGCGELSEIVNYSPTPHVLPPNGYFKVFTDAIFPSCILRVPAASVESYRNAETWKMFYHIKAIEEKLKIDIKEMYLLTDATTVVTATIADELKLYDVVWSSTQPEVATVDNNGKVKSLKTGTTVITASVDIYEAGCAVTVIEAGNSTIEGTINNAGTKNLRVNLFIKTEETGQTKKGIIGGYVLLATTVPNDNGEYSFENLPEGSYQVQVVLEGYDPEATEALSLSGDETLKDINFVVDDVIICDCPDPDVPTGMVETWQAASIQVYPNPFTDVLHISVETWRAASLRMINTAGAIVHTQTIANPDATIHLEHLPAGMYIIRLENGRSVKTFKIIKIQ